jgi:methionyl-tRNA synthetase
VNYELWGEVKTNLDNFRVDLALEFLWQKIKEVDGEIDQTQPWKLEEKELNGFLEKVAPKIQAIAYNLQPFLPETSQKILEQFSGKIVSQQPLFPRVS